MSKRILLVDLKRQDTACLEDCLLNYFDVWTSDNCEESLMLLHRQYKIIQVVLVSLDLFKANDYHFVEQKNQSILLRHIPVICIGPSFDSKDKLNAVHNDVYSRGAIAFFAEPYSSLTVQMVINNLIQLQASSMSSYHDISHNAYIEDEPVLASETYWNPKSIENLIIKSYMGAVCIVEEIGKHYYIVKTNDNFMEELVGNNHRGFLAEVKDFERLLNDSGKDVVISTLQKARANKDRISKGELLVTSVTNDHPTIYLSMRTRLIEQVQERAIFYCIFENDTDKYEAFSHEEAMFTQLQMIIQNFNMGITVAAEEYSSFEFSYSNDLFYSMFGYTREQYADEVKNDVLSLVLPEDKKRLMSALKTAVSTMESFNTIVRAHRRDGAVIWARIHCAVHYASEQKKLTIVTFYADVTARIKTEARMQELSNRLGNSEIRIRIDLTNERIIEYYSKYEPNMEKLNLMVTDYEKLVLSHVYPKDRENVWQEISYQKMQEAFLSGNTKYAIEYRRMMPNGEILWFAVTVVLMEEAITGNLHAYIYSHDIDEKIRNRIAKDRIIEAEVTDITLVNIDTGMSRLVKFYEHYEGDGTSYERFSFKSNIDRFVENDVLLEDKERCREFFNLDNLVRTIERDGVANISFWIKLEGENRIRKSGTVTYLDSTHKDLLITGRDITDLFRKEEEQKMFLQQAAELAEFASKAKSDFLSRMSHDMRTPLNGILGMNKLAQKANRTPEIDEYLRKVEFSGQHLLSLINDTLDLSKIESGKMEFHRETFPIEEFIEGINTVIKPLMDEKNIDFEIKLEREINRIWVDKLRFNQVFYNLLSNAAKYTPQGGKVIFSSQQIPGRDGMTGIRFNVKDNGIGMSEEFLKTLFEPFSQEYGMAHKEQRGTGLGLSIVKQILDLVNGEIRVKSQPGVGTEFQIDLFVLKDVEEDLVKNERYNSDLLRGLRVLLVDDVEINSTLVRIMLEYAGCVVDVKSNGEEAVNAFKQSTVGFYGLILTDIQMPLMDGFEEVRMIRSLERADSKTIPIIASTADAYDEMGEKIRAAGINDRIIKPIEADELCEKIFHLIRQNQEL